MKHQTPKERIVLKFRILSDKYHKLSLLFNELAGSLNIELKKEGINPNSEKQIREYLKTKNLNYDKIKEITKTNITFNDLKGGFKE